MRYSEQALNRLSVMQAIGSRGPISRTELTALLQLSSATITEVTADVVRRGLVRERKESIKRSGRPRIQLEVNPDGGIVVGTSLSEKSGLNVTFVNLASDILFQCVETLPEERSLVDLTANIASGLEAAIASSGLARESISRIAVGLPGLVDRERGILHWMATMEDSPYAVGPYIEDRLKIPVTVESGGIGMARAEYWFGRARKRPNFLLVDVDLTVVATLVSDGLPTAGSHGFNMEFAHIKVDSVVNGRECYCGGRGCLAAYCSFFGILSALNDKAAHEDLFSVPPLANGMGRFHDVVRRAQAGDPAMVAHFDMAGEKLGVAVGNYINACDPGYIFLMSSDKAMLDLMEPAFRAALKAATLPALEQNTEIEIGSVAPSWRELGMAALALEQLFVSS
ncbi:MAG TPA: ROK family transcriptional regulator [Sphingobium sp.]|uniref:ROK family transcriptional regulator n=1 Tax=Sphingobium sp. TaxID=1912891 RepID=UPI002ED6B34F